MRFRPGTDDVRRLLLAAMVGLLTGCTTLGPDYVEPGIDWLAEWQPELYGQLADGSGDPDLHAWWRRFEDPVLDALVAEARAANPSLRIAGLRVLESRAQLARVEGTRMPQLQRATAEAAYVDRWRDGPDPIDGDRRLVGFGADVTVAWELDFWGRFRRAIESADAGFLNSIANQRDAQVLLAAQVADAYFRWRTARLRINIAQRNARIQARSLEITERLFEGGQEAELDVQQARTQYLSTLATIPPLELAQVRARNALATLLGRPAAPLRELGALPTTVPEPDELVVHALPAVLLQQRPDVRAAAWAVAARSARIGVARADLFPAISLAGTVSYSADTVDATPDSATFVAGPGLRWDFLNYGRLENAVRIEDARLQQAIEAYRATVLRAAQEIDDAAARVARTRAQQRTLAEAVKASERALELANTLFAEGYVTFDRVLDAQLAVFAQSTTEVSARGEYLAAVVELHRALGGGWRVAGVEDLVPEATREEMEARTDWGGMLTEPAPAETTP